ncbi:uncharacterized protein MELLADRAFT_67847 [Melampsora larici-populina 98AG31]|uniref:Uncharacterized protein n=1 Tax=Melampsora larici-populina (strain 98AG31 / pathotype 3-4-7) TaxID=747676 RepID=F4S4N6_MELLP|nr:uncharacterized protein MELLADRAFT_67847 [Melampsora larici-populina 98AG31]EGG00394.1 hypothetical protein MELLADRAFT_67847 [Melampsora larici-populina 98AG31]
MDETIVQTGQFDDIEIDFNRRERDDVVIPDSEEEREVSYAKITAMIHQEGLTDSAVVTSWESPQHPPLYPSLNTNVFDFLYVLLNRQHRVLWPHQLTWRGDAFDCGRSVFHLLGMIRDQIYDAGHERLIWRDFMQTEASIPGTLNESR